MMKLLNNINYPEELKKLNENELVDLAEEIREFLINEISKTGGHLSSNLGVVELTIALLYCLNQPTDKIVWDVGHQAYVHKILTNRREQFKTLRKFNGLSGFPKPCESEYDSFVVGHSSTSVSVALGLAISRDLKKTNEKVVAVIGDGAFTGGMVYEALNHAGRSNSNILVILNDNQMSIGENTSSLNKSLNTVRSAKSYITVKKDINNALKKMPVVGDKTLDILDSTKYKIKNLVLDCAFFEELGFNYYGNIDGHNITSLIKYISLALEIDGPVLLHVNTIKGKGYTLAEQNSTKYHGVPKFDAETGLVNSKSEDSYSSTFSDTIVKMGRMNEKIVAITASMPDGTGLNNFKNMFPERYFDVGIAEEHAVTFAGGLSKNGLIPVVAMYSTFLQRAYDQIIHDIAIQNLHVIFCIDRAGLVGADGETHQGVFDISFVNHIPNVIMMAPANKVELTNMMFFAMRTKAPIFIRYPKSTNINTLINKSTPIELGKSNLIFKGEEIAIISVGNMLAKSLEVYNTLMDNNISTSLINLVFIKPVDINMIKTLSSYKQVVVIEDGIEFGGVSTIILKYLNDLNINTKVHSFSYKDKFISQGTVDELQEYEGISVENIYNTIINYR